MEGKRGKGGRATAEEGEEEEKEREEAVGLRGFAISTRTMFGGDRRSREELAYRDDATLTRNK